MILLGSGTHDTQLHRKKKLVNKRKKFRQQTKKLSVPVLSNGKPEKI